MLDARTAQLQTTEKNVVTTLKAAQDLANAKLAEAEEEYQKASHQKSEVIDSMQSELSELQVRASRDLHKLDETKKQRVALSESLHQLQIFVTVELKQQQHHYM